MDLILFGVFTAISFILIALGLFRIEHTELSLIGFVFLFLLSMVILNGQITYKIGTNTSSNFTYTPNASGTNITLLTSSFEEVTDIYGPITLGGALSHSLGYWLAIASIIGFIACILGLKHSRGYN